MAIKELKIIVGDPTEVYVGDRCFDIGGPDQVSFDAFSYEINFLYDTEIIPKDTQETLEKIASLVNVPFNIDSRDDDYENENCFSMKVPQKYKLYCSFR